MSEVMLLKDIAGYCPEIAIWKMITDLTNQIADGKSESKIFPKNIVVDGDSFLIVSNTETDSYYMAPEMCEGQESNPAQIAWTIGALIYYASTGRILFGGHGGNYQRLHPSVSLPVLPKLHQKLTPIMQQCLCSDPSERISLDKLIEKANEGLLECRKRIREHQCINIEPNNMNSIQEDNWPEEMKEI